MREYDNIGNIAPCTKIDCPRSGQTRLAEKNEGFSKKIELQVNQILSDQILHGQGIKRAFKLKERQLEPIK